MGWVEAAVCRTYNSERASSVMNTVSMRLASPTDDADAAENEARFRALKMAAQYDLLADNKQVMLSPSDAVYPLRFKSLSQLVKSCKGVCDDLCCVI
jgi:hypothetical protein